jgi:hypothetical protein
MEWIDVFYDGYGNIHLEFMNDLTEREIIEEAIFNKELSSFSNHKEFIEKINEIDELFRKITIEDPEPISKYWFENRILKYAWEGYRNSRKIFKKLVKPIELIDEELKEERKKVQEWGLDVK